jgi:oligoribonuclease NrnB/cAMP/cGMP phosphodiesterase (DHH superfamily)
MDEKNKVLVIFHRVDFDGIVSGSIVKKTAMDAGEKVTILGWNYNDKLPNVSELIDNFKTIVMVDISFPPEEMIKLKESGKLIWIDHHHTAIENSEKYGYSDAPGIRVIGTAACELTWKFFFGEDFECPLIIQYCSAYDTWNKSRFSWDEETLPIQYSLRSEYGLDFNKFFKDFPSIVETPEVINYFLVNGRSIIKYLKSAWEGQTKVYSFPVKVAGKYKGVCLLSPQSSSAAFDCVKDLFDIYIVANKKGDSYSISLYKEPDRIPEFNLADYLASIAPGAGGHASACGGMLTEKQFIHLVTKNEI